ncbi:MAG: DinB family protein [Bacteroidota bacterium]
MTRIATYALGDLERELEATRRVLARVPNEHLHWRPHPKSFTLGALATHVATLPGVAVDILRADVMDLATRPSPKQALPSRERILAAFDAQAAAWRDVLAATSQDVLLSTWSLRHREQVLDEAARLEVLRHWCLNHLIHHRAQLTVYLRLLDVPVPGLYGPSADEQR